MLWQYNANPNSENRVSPATLVFPAAAAAAAAVSKTNPSPSTVAVPKSGYSNLSNPSAAGPKNNLIGRGASRDRAKNAFIGRGVYSVGAHWSATREASRTAPRHRA